MTNLFFTDTYEKVYPDGKSILEEYSLIRETKLDIYLRYTGEENFTKTATLPLTPQYPLELTLGHLLTQRYFSSFKTAKKEIESIDLRDDKAFITLKKKQASSPQFDKVIPLSLNLKSIFNTGSRLKEFLPLKNETGSAHFCAIASAFEYENEEEGLLKIIFSCEDAGRHSAMDKCIGWAILNDINLSKCILFTSGRISGNMAAKAVCANVPVVAGKPLTTKEAKEIAKENNLKLIGIAKDHLKIFN